MSFANSPVFNRVIVPISLISSLGCGVLLLRESTGGKKCPNNDRMVGKVVVVTGANSGIGKETAKEVAKRGASVVMGCRHMGKCEAAAREIRQAAESRLVVCRFLNLANLDSVCDFAQTLRKELPHIDVLINNAGVMKPRPPKTTPETNDGFERQFGVNYLGHFLLTNLLADILTNGEVPGRVINVTGEAYKKGSIDLEDIDKSTLDGDERLNELYYQSKLANIMFTDTLSRLGSTKYGGKLTCNCINPGVVDTNISRYSNTPYTSPVFFIKPIKMLAMKTARQGAQTSIHLASDLLLKDVTGGYFDDCQETSKTCDICDGELADKLWAKSEEWADLQSRLINPRPGLKTVGYLNETTTGS